MVIGLVFGELGECVTGEVRFITTLSNDRAHQILAIGFIVGDLAVIRRKELNGSLCQAVCDPNMTGIVDKLLSFRKFIFLIKI